MRTSEANANPPSIICGTSPSYPNSLVVFLDEDGQPASILGMADENARDLLIDEMVESGKAVVRVLFCPNCASALTTISLDDGEVGVLLFA